MPQRSWLDHAKSLLNESLKPHSHELNELDWKNKISSDKEKLKRHLSAFSNYSDGGYLVFGVTNEAEVIGVTKEQSDAAIERLGNLAREALVPALSLDHATDTHENGSILLFVRIPESPEKPVHIRGKGYEESYIRAMGQTRQMDKSELGQSLMRSKIPRYEELEAFSTKDPEEILSLLDCDALCKIDDRPIPSDTSKKIEYLKSQKLVEVKNSNYIITNLGVLTCAKQIQSFAGHERREFRVIRYPSTSRIDSGGESEGKLGYAIGFDGLIKTLAHYIPSKEIIDGAYRRIKYRYPIVAIREILANAIIHQDFNVSSINPMVEVFDDRIEITSPGRLIPNVNVDRLIDTHPESRNELFARYMRQLKICEERGSGIDRAVAAIESYGLPPLQFIERDQSFRVIISGPKEYKHMSKDEKLLACYQHCCLKYEENERMTNSSLRKRLNILEKNHPMVTRLLNDAIKQQLIKKDEDRSSARKYTYYIPIWA